MIEQMQQQIQAIEESATALKLLAKDNAAVRKNAEIILTFVYLLKINTPSVPVDAVKEEN